jgi:RNA polymerase sigma-70 factor (ECF subfamily)
MHSWGGYHIFDCFRGSSRGPAGVATIPTDPLSADGVLFAHRLSLDARARFMERGAAPQAPEDGQKLPIEMRSDHSLLLQIRRGQEDAATALYLRYARRLRDLAQAQCSPGLAQQVEVEDIVQSVFRSFFRKAAIGLYDVPPGEELWKLFLVITLNKIRVKGHFHRAAKRHLSRTTGGAALAQASATKAAQDEFALTELEMVIEGILESLSPIHKQVVELRIAGFDVLEIAKTVNRSKRTVERILQEFRTKLGALL